MTREEIEKVWNDPASRRSGFYVSKADPRLIVPRRCGGWTPNLAHAAAIPVTVFLLAVLIVPALVLGFKGAGPVAVVAALAISLAVVCFVCRYLASRTK